ncbi:hypothetical protein Cgig2_015497 [Carnegiea gigantea]|uniref:TCP domain-containing protein n=1 Tax=Carnegiea gigantea TaxID=171969 RepID=A0A9Q1QHY8_9CARY|nr:hypothetical protein Cgig2_015497 [Carnegiea gigantea]
MFDSFNTTSSPISYNYLNDDHVNPTSNLLEELSYCSSYYHLPSPFIYNEIDNLGDFTTHPELTSIQEGGLEVNSSLIIDDSTISQATNKTDSNKGIVETINEIVKDGGNYDLIGLGVSHGSRRRRHNKGDRHSKISTAHGLRDRRMRLSLKVARPFFKLQDMLGYDKASRTIEWLLIQANCAIQEQLQSKYGSLSSAMTTSSSDYEVESIIIDKESLKEENSKGNKSSTCVTKNVDEPKEMRKRGTTKESRKEARDRARKRTLERMQSRRVNNNHKLRNTCSTWGAFKMVENGNVSNSQIHQSNTPIQIEDHVAGSYISNWSPLTIFHYLQNGEILQNVALIGVLEDLIP